jgi:hypothetical protein
MDFHHDWISQTHVNPVTLGRDLEVLKSWVVYVVSTAILIVIVVIFG